MSLAAQIMWTVLVLAVVGVVIDTLAAHARERRYRRWAARQPKYRQCSHLRVVPGDPTPTPDQGDHP